MSYDLKIAKITGTFLGIEDHGIFTFNLSLDYGGGGQGFGNICLASGKFPDERGLTAEFIMRILSATNAGSWEKVPGRTVYAVIDESRLVRGIAPLPTERGKGFTFIDGEFADYVVTP